MRVLVTAATKHGATAEIAAEIAATLVGHGIETAVLRPEDVTGLASYDAVVLGSAVYMGRWLDQARTFATEHADELSARPTWLFSSGPLGQPPKPDAATAVQVDDLIELTGACEHRLFSGRLDRDTLGIGERTIARAVRAPAGDWRDWDDVRGWADAIADTLASSV